MWFEFVTNTNCNWDCQYCAFSKVPDACMTEDSINRHQYVFDIIKRYREQHESVIVIEGGEIGLITSNDLLEILFKKIDQKVIINTNGEFFKQDRTQLYPYIDKFFYHIAPDAKTNFIIDKINVPIEVIYGIVDDDPAKLQEFVKFNNHIDITYIGIEASTFDSALYNETKEYQQSCKTLNPFASIDLAREVLCMCSARGCHVTIPLTEENFIKVLTEYNVFGNNDMCDTCYRTCKANPGDHIKQRKGIFKNVLGI